MIIDWNLRDPATPRQGGLPEALLYGFQWTSLMIFLVAVYRMLPPGWHFLFRILLALVATGAAMVVMVFCWLSYVINFGIDSI
ncbi:MAG: hypothetical protein ACAH88_01000 [Roseimicrobium sp.]